MGTKRRKFTKEFKQEAVRLVEAGGRTASEVALNLAISPTLLSKWMQASSEEGSEAFRGEGKRTAVEEELWRLRSQNKQLALELEFLKKVSRYFAKEPK